MVRRGASLARVLLAGALMLTTGLAGSIAAPATPAAAASVFHQVKNSFWNQRCIQPQSNAENALLVLDACDRDDLAQYWFFDRNSNGNRIINQLSGLCVYLNGPVAAGSPIIQTRCGTVTNYDWKNLAPPSYSQIISRARHENTGLCITPSSFQTGQPVKVVVCTGAAFQYWHLGSRI
jgi:hypothetical protein